MQTLVSTTAGSHLRAPTVRRSTTRATASSTSTPASSLEDVLQSELNDATVVSTGDLAERRAANRAVRLTKAGLVPDVEAFDAHLHAMMRGEIEVLEHREIGALESGTANGVAARIAGPLTGLRERQHAE